MSTILIPLQFSCLSRMFSGLRSQCTISCFLKNWSPIKIWIANLLTKLSLRPWNLFVRRNSYKFMLKSSKVMQRWPQKVKLSYILTMFFLSFGSNIFTYYNKFTSTFPCSLNLFLFQITFRATIFFVLWSITFTTDPNEPYPNFSST